MHEILCSPLKEQGVVWLHRVRAGYTRTGVQSWKTTCSGSELQVSSKTECEFH